MHRATARCVNCDAAMDPKTSIAIWDVFCREFRQDCFVNTVLAEGGLVLFKAKAPQPACHVYDGAQTKL
jgi:hypothetical protein